jgi:hypothetical protein
VTCSGLGERELSSLPLQLIGMDVEPHGRRKRKENISWLSALEARIP